MQVILDGARRQIQLLRDLLVTQTAAGKQDDFSFARGQPGIFCV